MLISFPALPLRGRLLLLLLLALAPAFVLAFCGYVDERQRVARHLEQDTLQLARLLSRDQQRAVEAARPLLDTLARRPEVQRQDTAACSTHAASLQRRDASYALVGAARLDGEIFCSSLPFSNPVNITDRAYFRRAVETGTFAVGEYQVGRITNLPTLNVAQPAYDDSGEISAVVFVALKLSSLGQVATDMLLPEGSAVTVVDREGRVLVHSSSSGLVGRSVAGTPLVEAIRSRGEGVAEVSGPDHAMRLYAFTSLGGPGDGSYATLMVGIPSATARAEADQALWTRLAALVGVTGLALAIAWRSAERAILRPTRVLNDVADRLSAGEAGARAGHTGGAPELRALADTFNQMADALQARQIERHEAIAALQRSERHFRLLTESTLDTVTIIDQQGTILYQNPAIEHVLGYPADDLLGRTAFELIHPDDLPRVTEAVRLLVESEHDRARLELRGRHRDESWRVLECVAIRLIDSPVQILVNSRDVTARREAEASLRTTTETLQAIVNSSPLAINAADLQGNITLWNPAAERTFGWSAEEVLGQAHPAILPSESNVFQQHLAQVARGELLENIRARRRTRSGKLLTVSFSAAPLRDGAGTVTGAVAIVADLTEEIRAQEIIRLQVAALEAAANAIVITDRDGTIEWINPAFTALTGYSHEETIGRKPRLLKSGLHDPSFYQDLWRTILDGRIWQGQIRNRRKDGTVYLDEHIITPVRSSTGEIEHFIAIGQDVTAREESAETLRQANGRLAEALAELRQTQQHIVEQERLSALGQMASGIAHDLNNTLSLIVGYSELLVVDPATLHDAAAVRQYLELILTAGQDASKVVSRLREFYRPREAGDLFEPISLASLVAHVISLTQPRWRDQALARGATIQVRTEVQDLPRLLGSPAELREALTNLVFNAVDALPAGGTLALRARADGAWAVLEVADTGIGMDEETRRRCLEPFFTTKGERGTGLGLGMVYGVVRRHEGTLEIASAPGRGTTVTLRLPLGTPAESDQSLPTVADHSPRPLRILLAEDDEQIRRILRDLLATDGHAVEVAADGREGLERFEQDGGFDLVITDRAMPRMHGDQFAAEVKRRAPRVPVIMLTGFGGLMATADDRPLGVDLVVGKPTTRTALRQAVARVIPEFPRSRGHPKA